MVINSIEKDFCIKGVKTMTTFLYVYIDNCYFFYNMIPFKYGYILLRYIFFHVCSLGKILLQK